jgi:membrane protein implicated in regulation of membrane protease activity
MTGEKERWTGRIVLKYTLLQIPGLALLVLILWLAKRWIELPSWLLWVLPALWVAKDIVLFPMVWRAYDSRARGADAALVGVLGVAREPLAPAGYVRVRGELWKGRVPEGKPFVHRGETVRIRAVDGLTLVVEREDQGDDSEQVRPA